MSTTIGYAWSNKDRSLNVVSACGFPEPTLFDIEASCLLRALLGHADLESAMKRFIQLIDSIKTSLGELEVLGLLSSDSKALEVICGNYMELSQELLMRLEDFRINGNHSSRKWKSFRQALKSVCSTTKIDGIAMRLEKYQDELNLHLVTSINKKADALALQNDESVEALNRHEQRTIKELLQSRDVLRREIEQQSEAIIQSNGQYHANMRDSVLMALGEAQSSEIRLLQSLRFPTMGNRYVEISEAHRQTFRWIFEDPLPLNCGWSNFAEWLENGRGVYWINGKAGSGKSTLMRYIFDSETTRWHLRKWAKDLEPGIAGFFFWNSGSLEQRSQTGLFRSLLFQALHQRPDLVRSIFPDEWARNSSVLANAKSLTWDWSLPALKEAFKRWINFAPTTSKLCFFIDAYVADELQGHRRMKILAKAEPKHAADLVDEIVTKASGVFLWVILVVRSLLGGLRNGDDVNDLRRRLQDLPPDLASLYEHMMIHVEQIYRGQASRTFQIFYAMAGVDPAVVAFKLDLAITANLRLARECNLGPQTEAEVVSRCDWLDVHLKTRCAGLIEIHRTEGYASKVTYMHRTVKEFLETEEVRKALLKATTPEFDPNVSVIISCIVMIKRSNSDTSTQLGFGISLGDLALWSCVTRAMAYARKADESGNRSYIRVLDILEETGIRFGRQNTSVLDHDELHKSGGFYAKNLFQEAIHYGLCSYAETKLKIGRSISSGPQEIPLLFHALHIDANIPIRSEIVEVLLRYGADPNQLWNGYSPWQQALSMVHKTQWRFKFSDVDKTSSSTLKNWAHIFKLLLEYGASPFTTCKMNHKVCQGNTHDRNSGTAPHSVRAVIIDVFDHWLPFEGAELRLLLDEQAAMGKGRTITDIPRGSVRAAAARNRPKELEEEGPRKRVRLCRR
ncbi:hypothetical protein G7Y89_g11005 [Cudoniella acicularis]|uniref:NACHT domain-containing protein n=1 Tax=Cudoniella acicularis TaxID=354080 RepID=A0A8H4VY86_9HELO|nr:hypothetical protein G7Y89_g11005 [Cudoniella acicularis]